MRMSKIAFPRIIASMLDEQYAWLKCNSSSTSSVLSLILVGLKEATTALTVLSRALDALTWLKCMLSSR